MRGRRAGCLELIFRFLSRAGIAGLGNIVVIIVGLVLLIFIRGRVESTRERAAIA